MSSRLGLNLDFCVRLGAMSAHVVPALLGAVVSRNLRKRVLFLALAVIGSSA